jgi:hypothetical protein
MSVISYTDFNVSGNAFGLFIFDNKAYVTFNYSSPTPYYANLMIYDVSNPASPVLLCDYYENHFKYGLGEIAVAQHYAYIGGGGGMHIYDVSNPSAPSYTGTYEIQNYCSIIRIKDNYIYVSAYRYIYTLDITNPTSPQEVATFRNP